MSSGFDAICERFGDRFDPEVLAATVTHWAPRVATPSVHLSPPILDVPYGAHERHRLDLFPVAGPNAPVVLYVHGGGFVAGDKRISPPFYSNIGRYFASHGSVGACMNYRHAPVGGWPAAAEDLEAAVSWLIERADLYGGDAGRIVVIGQSAGACHVATWLFHPSFEGGSRGKIASAALMSGFYKAVAPLAPGQKAYFGDDPGLYGTRSVLTHARAARCPLLITMAQHDPAYLQQHARELAALLEKSAFPARLVELPGHNHVSPVMSLGSDDDTVGALLLKFVRKTTE